MFAVDGSLLVCKEKSNLQTVIEEVPAQILPTSSELEDVSGCLTEMNLANFHAEIPLIRVLIVDAMAILQGMKKVPGMKMIAHLKKAFLNKILRLSK